MRTAWYFRLLALGALSLATGLASACGEDDDVVLSERYTFDAAQEGWVSDTAFVAPDNEIDKLAAEIRQGVGGADAGCFWLEAPNTGGAMQWIQKEWVLEAPGRYAAELSWESGPAGGIGGTPYAIAWIGSHTPDAGDEGTFGDFTPLDAIAIPGVPRETFKAFRHERELTVDGGLELWAAVGYTAGLSAAQSTCVDDLRIVVRRVD